MSDDQTLEEYKAFVKSRLDGLLPVFAHASIGDFSERLTIPDKEDEFTQLYVGIQIVLEVIREQMLSLQQLNHQLAFRIQDLHKEIEKRKETEISLNVKQKELEKVTTNIEQDKVLDEAMLSSIGDGVVAVDRDGNVMFINQRAESMFMIPSAQLIGKPLVNLVAVEDEKEKKVEPENRPTTKALKDASVTSVRGFVVRTDGTKVAVKKTVTPVLLHGQTIGAIEVLSDISKEVEVDKMKTEFLTMAAHQLRTPLSTMRWTMELLLSQDQNTYPDRVKLKIEHLYEDILRLILLVNDLLNVSRIEQGRFPDNPVPTDIGHTLEEVLSQMRTDFQKKQISVRPKLYDKGNFKVTVDPQRFAEVLRNLISNAIKYNTEKGTVTITVEPVSNGVQICVIDTGIGIAPVDLGKVFSKFYRAENAILETKEGTGLGLYVVQSLVKSWGGTVHLASKLHEGTTVAITLPFTKSVS